MMLNNVLRKAVFTGIASKVDTAITVLDVVNRHASVHVDEPIVDLGADGFA